ncbi:MAG TPA: DICT sensory domain-containing protein [Solirubrobacteraceae bacterium]|nr:DICT sensory domain-containing protein [Solirubrobacteraceae bacterium]
MQGAGSGLGIGEVVERTGVAEATLRMWERRYGFPAPERLASGHRRYSEREIELIRAVATKRAAGLALAVAIEQAQSEGSEPATSVFATLRRRRPDLEPRLLLKPMMLALSQAIEDEALARAERLMVFGSFQRERFYRAAQWRWRELARSAEVAVAFADFARLRAPRDAPVEVPVSREHPLNREWSVVCEGQDFALCLAGWEPPESGRRPDGRRRFEAIWSVEPEVVREASRICSAIAGAQRPAVAEAARRRLEAPLPATPESQLRLASAVTARMLAHVSEQLAAAAG